MPLTVDIVFSKKKWVMDVLRRRLFIYALGMIAGIVSSYTVLEHRDVIAGAGSIIAILMICSWLFKNEEVEDVERKRIVLAAAFGVILFAYAYYMSDADMKMDGKNFVTVKGTVCRAEYDGEKLIAVIDPKDRDMPRILCRYYGKTDSVADGCIYDISGAEAVVSGKLSIPDGQRNPGTFNYRNYLKSRSISYCMSAGSIVITERSAGPLSMVRRYLLRQRFLFEREFSGDTDVYGLVKGIVFGDKSCISEETYEEFIENNTAHILAVSGLHIGFILVTLNVLTRSRRTILVSCAVMAIIFVYGEMTMWSISTVRSVMVAVLGMVSFYIRKPFDLLSALSASAICILAANPYQLFSAGFQMSFLAMVGTAFLMEPLGYFVGKTIAAMFSVQIAMLPYIAEIFNRMNIISAFVNIPVVSVASVMTPISIIVLVSGMIIGVYPDIMIYIIESLASAMIEINRILNFSGGFSARVISFNPALTLFIYMISFFLCSEMCRVKALRKMKKDIAVILLMIAVPSLILGFSYRNRFLNDEIVFIDVGQGDAVHVRADGRDLLFDGGGDRKKNIGKTILAPYFLKNGAEDVDMNFLTHLHTDHCRGSTELGKEIHVGSRMISCMYRGKDTGIKGKVFLEQGDSVKICACAEVKVLWPVESGEHDERNADENEKNMVMMLYCKGARIMITGDLLEKDEQDMVKYYSGTDELKCDVLKVAHHGSAGSSCSEFLDAADPSVAVIQVGKNNMYGHPDDRTVRRLKKRGITVLRNDLHGAVGLDVEGGKIKPETMIG